MTATYWDTDRRIVEFGQHGEDRAAYGEALRIADDRRREPAAGIKQFRLRQHVMYADIPPNVTTPYRAPSSGEYLGNSGR